METSTIPIAAETSAVAASAVETGQRALANGEPILIVDDDPAEGAVGIALIAVAKRLSVTTAAQMIRHGGGVLGAVMPERRLDALGVGDGDTVGAEGLPTGRSVADRAAVCRALARIEAAREVTSPGNLFVWSATDGGTLVREGLEEAAVDLVSSAGADPVAAFCHLLDSEGNEADEALLGEDPALAEVPVVRLDDVVMSRLSHGSLVEAVTETVLPTQYGIFRAHGFRMTTDNSEHLALSAGEIDAGPVLVRIHRACRLGDILPTACSCRHKLETSLRLIADEGRGVLVHLRPDPAVAGLVNHTNPPMDRRQIGLGAQILKSLGVEQMRLITNSQHRYPHLAGFGLTIAERVPFTIPLPAGTRGVGLAEWGPADNAEIPT